MDGFAVKLLDLSQASKEHPVTLKIAGVIAATPSATRYTIIPQTCVHIMTGAVVPNDPEAIVPIENVMVEGDGVTFFSCPQAGAHIRRKGQYFKIGQPVLSAGTKIGAQHILPLTTLGTVKILGSS